MSSRPNYLRVFLTFARNSLVRDMTFRTNFLLESVVVVSWAMMYVGFYVLIFRYTPSIGADTGWSKYAFFIFLATTHFINSLVQAFFMDNCDEFSELIRTGGLDFLLLKPIDTQFLVSLRRVNWASLSNFLFAFCLLIYALVQLNYVPSPWQALLYFFYVGCGVAILYSLMIVLASAAIWLGRNQSVYDFWFYITNFSRYPMEIYSGRWGTPLRHAFTFVIPILIVVNVPARILARPVQSAGQSWLPLFALAATAGSLLASRWVFHRALISYRSASS